MQDGQFMVVGGGLVGASIAYGAARRGVQVVLLDQGDVAHRASRGNFGLVWVQSKGDKLPRYAQWSRDAAKLWPKLAEELLESTGVDTALQQPGGFWIGFSEQEIQERQALLERIDRTVGGIPFEMLDHSALKQRLPGIGPKVAGGSYCKLDGHANPLMLMHALHAGLLRCGAQVVSGVDVVTIKAGPYGFEAIAKQGGRWRAGRLALAAGLGNFELAKQIGLHAPVLPNRGQVLITERLKPFLPYPTNKARQTNEGTVQLGYSVEDVGLDDGTTASAIEWIAKRGVETFPALSRARLVRAWGALRVMTPDGLPIYQESSAYPGSFVATSHSGVSLAATHAFEVGPWMAGLAQAPQGLDAFKGERFLDTTRSFSHAH
ncbi:NAD(P)/FAD-dependent oxidoreductase [Bordetella tumulicola]|uniref:NAD(P)/FAD-dependent oxidoreductase n=1 Tax=Bordetella tumulicola TaxID=1649133 RepID=UPI0039EE0761